LFFIDSMIIPNEINRIFYLLFISNLCSNLDSVRSLLISFFFIRSLRSFSLCFIAFISLLLLVFFGRSKASGYQLQSVTSFVLPLRSSSCNILYPIPVVIAASFISTLFDGLFMSISFMFGLLSFSLIKSNIINMVSILRSILSFAYILFFSFFSLYLFILLFLFFTSSLWLFYFGLELQWMLLFLFFILGSSVWRGLLNYWFYNAILNILFSLGLILVNKLFFCFSFFGKLGFYPFFIILVSIISCCSYFFVFVDLMNKFVYFGGALIIWNLLMFYFFNINFILFLYLFLIVFGIKFIPSIKIILLVSSLINFLFIIILISLSDLLFSFIYLSFYFMIMLILIFFLIISSSFSIVGSIIDHSFCYNRSSCSIAGLNTGLSSDYISVSSYSISSISIPLDRSIDSFCFIVSFSSISISSLSIIIPWLDFSLYYFNSISYSIYCYYFYSYSPVCLVDLLFSSLFILLSYILFMLLLLILFSFFPTFMFFSKFFFLVFIANHSISLIFHLIIFLTFIFQGYFIRSSLSIVLLKFTVV